MSMRKIIIYICCFSLIVFGFLPVGNVRADYELDYSVLSDAVYLVNLDTDTVMFEKNSTKRVYPASLTKIMTAILTIENIPDLDSTEISLKPYIEDIVYRANLQAGGALSLSGILRGETLSARNLLYAIMLPSGNEAAMMLADYVSDGSVDYFVKLMNEKAKELGAENTNFTNPNGLHDPNQYTTAYDMYLISRYAMQLPGLIEISNTVSYNGGPTNKHEELIWRNTNKLIDRTNSTYYYAPVSGFKTGSTPEAGRCLISTAARDGYNYLAVVMGAPYYDENGAPTTVNIAFTETKALYRLVFETYKVKTLLEKGEGMGELPLVYGADGKEHLLLMSGERYTALLPNEIQASSVIYDLQLPARVAAPVERGDVIGEVILILADKEVGRVPIVAAESAPAGTLALALKSVNKALSGYAAKFVIVFSVLFILFYIALMVVRNLNKIKYGSVTRRKKL